MKKVQPKKIVIVGAPGSGKTTMGKKLSAILDIPSIDLDDIYWLPGWIECDRDDFVKRVNAIMDQPEWILCGNYTRSKCKIWENAEMIVWLDYPFFKMLWRVLMRSIRRIRSSETCCNGNYETWGRLLSRNSIVFWLLSSFPKRKKKTGKFFAENRDGNIELVRIRSEAEEVMFLEKLREGFNTNAQR